MSPLPAPGVSVRVSCCQLAPVLGDLAANVAMSTSAVSTAIDAGARLVVLPELVTSGYVFESVAEAEGVAITADHSVFAAWARQAARNDGVVVGGFCELGDDGVYNSAAVVDAAGVRAVYRKTHLWDREKLWFRAGSVLPPVLDTAIGRVAVAICYDIEFPELTRHLGLAGADIVAVPTNWPFHERPADERPPEVVLAMAAARVNRMPIACCDRSGIERGQRWTEGTTIIGSDGWPRAVAGHVGGASGAGVHGVATADLDLTAGRQKRFTGLADLFADRRTDLYGA